jgi:hypothetical protein
MGLGEMFGSTAEKWVSQTAEEWMSQMPRTAIDALVERVLGP